MNFHLTLFHVISYHMRPKMAQSLWPLPGCCLYVSCIVESAKALIMIASRKPIWAQDPIVLGRFSWKELRGSSEGLRYLKQDSGRIEVPKSKHVILQNPTQILLTLEASELTRYLPVGLTSFLGAFRHG